MKSSELNIQKFIFSDFQENCYLVHRVDSSECVIVDPGMEPDDLIAEIREQKLTPVAILVTHGHWDHIGGIDNLKKIWPKAEIMIGEKEASKLTDPAGNLSLMFGVPMTSCGADTLLKDSDVFQRAGITFEARLIPGHSPGHMVYCVTTEDQDYVFVGDVIFFRSIGRTDFPDGNMNDLINGIQKQLMTRPDDTILLNGHGPRTTVGRERKYNPYLQYLC